LMRTAKPKVLLAWSASDYEVAVFRKYLGDAAEIIVMPKTAEQFRDVVKDVDVIVGGFIPDEYIKVSSRLKFIQILSAGADRFNFKLLKEKGITLATVSGANASTVAEHAILLILALSRRLVFMDKALKEGKWIPYKHETMIEEVYGKNLGIIGYGNIGSEIAKRAYCLGMKIYVIKRNPLKGVKYRRLLKYVGGPESLDYVLRISDYVVLSVPLTKETLGLIGERELRLMKKTAYLINVSRGPVIDEKALYRALTEGWIAGAGLDVWWLYPPHKGAPSTLGIHKLPNVIATPHKAGWSKEARRRALILAARNVRAFLKGKKVINVVDYEKGY